MNNENSKRIHFLKTNPKDWIGASLPKFKTTAQEVMIQAPLTKKELKDMSWFQRHEHLNSYAVKIQARRWENEGRIKLEDSHFTLIVPIHNEENSLPSFLRTLMLSDVPSTVHAKIIFITNACTDSSSPFIDEFLSSLGAVEEKPLTGEFKDQKVSRNCKTVQQDSITFIHVDTETRGKANALGIGNAIARASGDIIAMSVDANNYLEPDAIRIMFTHAYHAFKVTPKANDTVLLCGMGQTETKESTLKSVMNKASKVQYHLVEDNGGVVNGWFLAWNTEWMESIGGPLEVALEDYAMGILARVNNFKFEQVKGANVWGYLLNDFKGLLDTRARYVRGNLQILNLLDHDPSVVRILEKEAYYMKNLPARLTHLLRKSKEKPQNLPRYVVTFLLWEYALRRGKRDYKRNPTNQSWEKIDATY